MKTHPEIKITLKKVYHATCMAIKRTGKQNAAYTHNGVLLKRAFWHIPQRGWNLSIMLSHKKTNTVWFHLYDVSTVVKLIETVSRKVVTGGWGEGKWVQSFSLWPWKGSEDRWCWWWHNKMNLMPQNCTLKNGEVANSVFYIHTHIYVFIITKIFKKLCHKMVTAAMKLKDAYSLEGKLWPT